MKVSSSLAQSKKSISRFSIWHKHWNIKADEEGHLCGLQDINLFSGNIPICILCKEARGTIDHLVTRCNRMLSHDYTRRHNEVVRCLYIFPMNMKLNHQSL